MPGGVVFLVCIPTLSYEHELVFGVPVKRKKLEGSKGKVAASPRVDLRLKEVKTRAQLPLLDGDSRVDDDDENDDDVALSYRRHPRGYPARSKTPVFVSMETVGHP